jgi:CRP/FNR family cyclic AMP-dependent transcriptional regulator
MENINLLKKVRMFQELSDEELAKFQDISEEKPFKGGEIIIEENTEGQALYIIKRGTVVVSKVDGALESELVKLFAGEHFGEMSLVEDARTSARVSAYNDVECLVIKRTNFLDLLEGDIPLAAKVYKAFTQTLCDRLRQTSSDLVTWKPEIIA